MMLSISALSPSGRHLAYAVEQTRARLEDISSGATAGAELESAHHAEERDKQLHLRHRSEASIDSDCTSVPSLPLYQVAIVSCLAPKVVPISPPATTAAPAAPVIRQPSGERAVPSSSAILLPGQSGQVRSVKCPLKAPVTALQWLDESHLACGLQDGTVTIVVADSDRRWESQAAEQEQRCSDGMVPVIGEYGPGRQQATLPPAARAGAGWTPIFSRCFHRTRHGGLGPEDKSRRVMRIRLSGDGPAGGEGTAAGAAAPESEPTMWVLYPDRVLVGVGVEALVTVARQQMEHRAENSPSRQGSSTSTASTRTHEHGSEGQDTPSQQTPPAGPTFAKLQLEGQDEVLDIVACSAPPGLFEVRSERHSHVILASGVYPALAFYPIGTESRSFGLASIAWAVASRVTSLTVGVTVGVLDGMFGLVGLRGRGRKAVAAVNAKAKGRGRAANGGEDEANDDASPAPLVLHRTGGLEDGWRKVSHLCLDPSGRLAAAADGFGRVMLVDCTTRQILRMWKGVRDAECGWLEIVESWEGRRVASVRQKDRGTAVGGPANATPMGEEVEAMPVIGLYLAILAPLRGRVELWRMRHGPCVRTIPAPASSRLLTSRPKIADSSERSVVHGGGKRRYAETLTSCYLLSAGAGSGCGSKAAPEKLRLTPLFVEEDDLADLPSRLSREPTVDDAYRLRKFAAAVAEIRSLGSSPTTGSQRGNSNVIAEKKCLPAGQTSREEFLFQLLSQLESVETLAKAVASLGVEVPVPQPRAASEPSKPDDAIELSSAFQRRVCDLCRERAEQAAVAAVSDRMATVGNESENDSRALLSEKGSAIASLRFRTAAFELYNILESVEINPAAEDEDDDPAFLPPGKRGWKHGDLCEEAAGWADMVRGVGEARGAPLPTAELPDFQEFLGTASVVLDVVEGSAAAVPRRGSSSSASSRDKSVQLLRFVTIDASAKERRQGATVGGAPSSRGNRDFASPVEAAEKLSSSTPRDDETTATADGAQAEFSRCRRRLVGWLFRPLLSDAFALASLTQALSLLGLGGGHGQAAGLVRDMAEWFLTLPVGRAADTTVGREAQNCPVLRWLKGVIISWASPASNSSKRLPPQGEWVGGGGAYDDGGRMKGFLDEKSGLAGMESSRMDDLFGNQVDGGASGGRAVGGDIFRPDNSPGREGSDRGEQEVEKEGEEGEEWSGRQEEGEGDAGDFSDERGNLKAGVEEILRPMYEACAASPRLENASMLSVVTAEALAACREKLEESSLGQVAIGGGEAWVTLARRLRVCLFVDHRLQPFPGPENQMSQRDRASVRQFMEGEASIYAFVAKDQIMSFRDLSFAACSAQERTEVEASARSQRESTEVRTTAASSAASDSRAAAERRRRVLGSPALAREGDVPQKAVAAASSLAATQMDEHWRMVQAVAARVGTSPTRDALGGRVPVAFGDQTGDSAVTQATNSGSEKSLSRRGSGSGSGSGSSNSSSGRPGFAAAAAGPLPPGAASEISPTTLFFMRSHAQPIVLACHRARWLALSWASTGPPSAEAVQRATDPSSVADATRAVEAAIRRLSLAVDHLSYLRTANPFLAGCVAYWLWEHGGVRAHCAELARGGSGGADGGEIGGEDGQGSSGTGRALVEEGRPAREAFLAAAEEFLKVEALFPARRYGSRRETRGVGGGETGAGAAVRGRSAGRASEVSFGSLLTEGAMQGCPWPGAWDRWVEESLRDAQVRPPLESAVAAHSTLLRALRVNTVCGLSEGEILRLFGKGHKLCAEGSLWDESLVSLLAPAEGYPAALSGGGQGGSAVGLGPGLEGGRHLMDLREAYVRRALEAIVPRPAQNVYRLARDFGVSEDTVRGWHCLVLLRRGHDVLAEEALSQIFSLQDLAGNILTIMRLRLKRVLNFLETSPRASMGLLASLDADTCQWVRSARAPDAGSRGGGVQLEQDAGEPLRSTHGVLLCLARALPADSRHKRQANALVTMVSVMLQHLGGGGPGGGYRR